MNLNHLLGAAAAVTLCAGAAHAQQSTGVAPNQASPASPTQSKTGVPSVDSTRPAGENAGATNLPNGEVTGSTSSSTTTSATTSTDVTVPASSTTDTTSATSASSTAAPASAVVSTQMVTNGPVPDTPENRRKYGQPLSHAGKMTAARGN